MRVVLELSDQSSNIRTVTVRHDIVIGRGADCNLRISAPQVSRRHCFLRIHDGRVTVTDLESCNGTWLDGEKTVPGKRYRLEDGMNLAVGPIRFTARVTGDEDLAKALPIKTEEVIEPTEAKDADDEMHFALEHVGDAAEADAPTRDSSAVVASGFSLPPADAAQTLKGDASEEIIQISELDMVDDSGIIDDADIINIKKVEVLDDEVSEGDFDEVIVLDDDDEVIVLDDDDKVIVLDDD